MEEATNVLQRLHRSSSESAGNGEDCSCVAFELLGGGFGYAGKRALKLCFL